MEGAELKAGPPQAPKLLVIAARCGRMANRMVLFANLMALAEEQGHRLVNFTFHSYADSFVSTGRDIFCQYPAPLRPCLLDAPPLARFLKKTRLLYQATRGVSRLNEKLSLWGRSVLTLREDPGTEVTWLESAAQSEPFRRARVVFVYGWRFRAPELVKRHAERIRAYFRPQQAIEEAAARAVDALRCGTDVIVGVHVRHGDYPTLNGGQFYFSTERYARWMRELEVQFAGRRVSFLVCSDEPRRESEFPGLSVGFGPGNAVADLYALAYCDYIMGPMSTFSQWSSFYGNTPLFHIMGSDARIELDRFAVSFLAEIP